MYQTTVDPHTGKEELQVKDALLFLSDAAPPSPGMHDVAASPMPSSPQPEAQRWALYYTYGSQAPKELIASQRCTLLSIQRLVAGKQSALFKCQPSSSASGGAGAPAPSWSPSVQALPVERCMSIVSKVAGTWDLVVIPQGAGAGAAQGPSNGAEERDAFIKALHAVMMRFRKTASVSPQPPPMTPSSAMAPSPMNGMGAALAADKYAGLPNPDWAFLSMAHPVRMYSLPAAASSSAADPAGLVVEEGLLCFEPVAAPSTSASGSGSVATSAEQASMGLAPGVLYFVPHPAPSSGQSAPVPRPPLAASAPEHRLHLSRMAQLVGGKESRALQHPLSRRLGIDRCFSIFFHTGASGSGSDPSAAASQTQADWSLECATHALRESWIQSLHAVMCRFGRDKAEFKARMQQLAAQAQAAQAVAQVAARAAEQQAARDAAALAAAQASEQERMEEEEKRASNAAVSSMSNNVSATIVPGETPPGRDEGADHAVANGAQASVVVPDADATLPLQLRGGRRNPNVRSSEADDDDDEEEEAAAEHEGEDSGADSEQTEGSVRMRGGDGEEDEVDDDEDGSDIEDTKILLADAPDYSPSASPVLPENEQEGFTPHGAAAAAAAAAGGASDPVVPGTKVIVVDSDRAAAGEFSGSEGATPSPSFSSASAAASESGRSVSVSPAAGQQECMLAESMQAAAALVPSAVQQSSAAAPAAFPGQRGRSDGAIGSFAVPAGNGSGDSGASSASQSADSGALQRALDEREAAVALLRQGQFFTLFTRAAASLEDRAVPVFLFFVPASEGPDTPGSLYWQDVPAVRAQGASPFTAAAPLAEAERVQDERNRFRLGGIKQMRSGRVTPALCSAAASHLPADCCLSVRSTSGLLLSLAASSPEARDAWMRAVHAVLVQHGMRAKVEQAAGAAAQHASGASTMQPPRVTQPQQQHLQPPALDAGAGGNLGGNSKLHAAAGHLAAAAAASCADGPSAAGSSSRGGSPASRRSPRAAPGHGHSQSVDRGAALALSAAAASFNSGTGGKTISFSDPTSFFVLQRKIGEGSYGAVYQALDLRARLPVAVKIISFSGVDSSALKQEIRLLRHCHSPHVLSYRGAFQRADQVWIVTEYCDGGSLSDMMLAARHTFSENQIAVIMRQTLRGLAYLHAGTEPAVAEDGSPTVKPKKRIIHRDVKGANILVAVGEDGQPRCKLADFGVSGTLDDALGKHRTVIGTPHWMAPECLLSDSYSELVDVWSLGITAYELAVGQPPHAELHSLRAALKIPAAPPPTLPQPARYSAELHSFLRACLVKDWRQRPSAQQLLSHPFVAQNKSPDSILLPMVNRMRERTEARERMDKAQQPQQKQQQQQQQQQHQQADEHRAPAQPAHQVHSQPQPVQRQQPQPAAGASAADLPASAAASSDEGQPPH